jgi:myo-inositol-1(or 4)-monophosphatase
MGPAAGADAAGADGGVVCDEELLAVAVEAARAAAPLLLERFAAQTRRDVRSKSSPTDLVSEADVLAEQAIRRVLMQRRPDDAVMGEEGDDLPGTSGLRWIVDPLDGTTNFLFGVPQWCISVACEGRAGVVFDPLREELFAATRTTATLAGANLTASTSGDLGTALVATGFGYESAVRELQAPIAARIVPRVRDIRRGGSAALDMAWAAAGRLDGYFEFGTMPWDSAAGELLCAAAGLTVTPLGARDGLPAGIMVAPPALTPQLLALIDA